MVLEGGAEFGGCPRGFWVKGSEPPIYFEATSSPEKLLEAWITGRGKGRRSYPL